MKCWEKRHLESLYIDIRFANFKLYCRIISLGHFLGEPTVSILLEFSFWAGQISREDSFTSQQKDCQHSSCLLEKQCQDS